jgi:hypothetical protein
MDGAVIPNNVRGNSMANLAGVLKELEQERERLEKAIAVIGKLAGGNHASHGKAKQHRPKMSLSARRKIAAAQRARWAKLRTKQAKKAA